MNSPRLVLAINSLLNAHQIPSKVQPLNNHSWTGPPVISPGPLPTTQVSEPSPTRYNTGSPEGSSPPPLLPTRMRKVS